MGLSDTGFCKSLVSGRTDLLLEPKNERAASFIRVSEYLWARTGSKIERSRRGPGPPEAELWQSDTAKGTVSVDGDTCPCDVLFLFPSAGDPGNA